MENACRNNQPPIILIHCTDYQRNLEKSRPLIGVHQVVCVHSDRENNCSVQDSELEMPFEPSLDDM